MNTVPSNLLRNKKFLKKKFPYKIPLETDKNSTFFTSIKVCSFFVLLFVLQDENKS